MSLQYVTRKLQTQSLVEKEGSEAMTGEAGNSEADPGHPGLPVAEEVDDEEQQLELSTEDDEAETQEEDSGTESDDEMEEEQNNLASSGAEKVAKIARGNFPDENPLMYEQSLRDSGALCEDNYSSEEELKEINSSERKKTYIDPAQLVAKESELCAGAATAVVRRAQTARGREEVAVSAQQSARAQSATTAAAAKEKRKWSEMSRDESSPVSGSHPACLAFGPASFGPAFGPRAGSNGSSGDEEVSGLLLLQPSPTSSTSSSLCSSSHAGVAAGGRAGRLNTPTPVQFCASPPLEGVHRPRHSQSPPPKLFHLAASSEDFGGRERYHPIGVAAAANGGVYSPSGFSGFSGVPRHLGPTGATPEEEVRIRFLGQGSSGSLRRETPSPSKRPRSRTPRPHNLQRPCLDFEKMQQIKKRVVTSWRPQGTELSLFCW